MPRVAPKFKTPLLRRPTLHQPLPDLSLPEKAEALGIEQKTVLTEIAKVAFASMRNFITIDSDGHPNIDMSGTDADNLDAISEVTSETVLEHEGRGEDKKTWTVRKTKIKLHDKLAALEKLGQHTGIYKDRDQQFANSLMEAVVEIQARTSRAPLRRRSADEDDSK